MCSTYFPPPTQNHIALKADGQVTEATDMLRQAYQETTIKNLEMIWNMLYEREFVIKCMVGYWTGDPLIITLGIMFN